MTGRPAAFSALALASTASVADSEIAAIRAEIRVLMATIVADSAGDLSPISPHRDAVARPGETRVWRLVRRGGGLRRRLRYLVTSSMALARHGCGGAR